MKARLSIILLSLLSGLSCFAGQEQAVTVAGRVVDYKADPVEGASVACYCFELKLHAGRDAFELLSLAETTLDGRFSFKIKKTQQKPLLVARKQGLALGWKMAIVPNTTVVLGRPHRMEGVVVDGAGGPIPDATVRIFLYHRVSAWWQGDLSRPFSFIVEEIAPVIPQEWFVTKTDAEGKFAFGHIPDEATADFHVQAPGWAPAYTFREGFGRGRQFAVGRTDIRIVLEPEATISGRVIDEDSGRPVSGLNLSVKPKSGPYVHEEPVISDSQGQFQIKGLPAGTYALQIQYQDDSIPNWISAQQIQYIDNSMPDWIGKDVEVSARAGQTVQDVEVPVGKGATLEVLVNDSEGGSPVEGAIVQIEHESEDCSSCKYARVTDTNGVTRFRLPLGRCRIQAHKPGLGYMGNPESVRLEKGQHLQYTVGGFTWAAMSISGRVLDSQGRKVAGASVMWMGAVESTDEQGQFEFGDDEEIYTGQLPGSELLLARDESTGQAAKVILRNPDRSYRIQGDITLQPGATLTGYVTDPNGNGVPAAYVRFLKRGETKFITEVTTNTQGFYRIPALPAFGEEPLTLVVRASGFGPIEVPCPTFEAGQKVRVNSIELPPTDQSVSGVVVDANDQPIPEAVVYLFGPEGRAIGQPSRVVAVDDRGRFRIGGVCKGPLRIGISNGFIDAYGGARDVKVVLGKQLVHTRYQSLVGKSLPDLAQVGLDLSPDETRDKLILLCFFDMHQRPSRHCIMQLAKQVEKLKDKGVTVVAVQASKVDENVLNEWIKKYNIPFPVGMIEGDDEKTCFAWGVKSLPWLILTDRSHVVTAEGFSLNELDDKIERAD